MPESAELLDSGAEDLLRSFVTFLKPVIQGYTLSPGKITVVRFQELSNFVHPPASANVNDKKCMVLQYVWLVILRWLVADHIDTTEKLINGSEGKNLLSALAAFAQVVALHATPEPHNEPGNVLLSLG